MKAEPSPSLSRSRQPRTVLASVASPRGLTGSFAAVMVRAIFAAACSKGSLKPTTISSSASAATAINICEATPLGLRRGIGLKRSGRYPCDRSLNAEISFETGASRPSAASSG